MTDQNVYEKIAQQIDEPILERRTCRRSGEKFPIFAGDKELLEKISPIINGKKYPLPLPTLSPRMREIRRLMRRNDTKLYKTTCVLTGQTLFSFYHPEMGYKIGDAYQWSAHVDNTNLGKAYDFSQPFGKQFAQLFQQTIKQHALIVGSMENSLYTHNIGGAKNCYMVFDAGMIEDIMYAVRVANTKKMIDGFEVRFTERAYECIGVSKCQNIFYAHNCSSCSDSALLYGCHGCHHCIGCTNLVNKSYHLFNKPVSKDEFDAARKKLFSGSRADVQKFKEQFTNLLTATPRSALQQTNTTNSIGFDLTDTENTVLCYSCNGTKNIRYSSKVRAYSSSEDLMDITSRGGNMQRCYELNCSGSDDVTNSSNLHFGSYLFRGVTDSLYSANIPYNGSFLFGCTDLTNKQYCILNKQYTKEEYFALIPQIINHLQTTGERGEFFDPQYAPFPYNDTIAHDYYPVKIVKDMTGKIISQNAEGEGTVTLLDNKILANALLDFGGSEKIPIKRRTVTKEVNITEEMLPVKASNLPDNVHDASEKICEQVVLCAQTDRPFRVTAQELAFYKQYGIPLPLFHPEVRYQHRIQQAIKTRYYLRTCDKTGEEIISVYPADTPFQVYSEEAYKQEVFG